MLSLPANKNNWLIIANGEPIRSEQLVNLTLNNKILVLDGALSRVLSLKIKPDIALGDFDSTHQKYKELIEKQKKMQFIYAADQNKTDLEKALEFLSSMQANKITICNATGWRLDHTLYNLRLLKRFYDQFELLFIINSTEKIYFISDKLLTLTVEKSEPLSLLAFPEADVTSQGLSYEMNHYHLKFAVSESISNRILLPRAEIRIKGEAILITSHETRIFPEKIN